VSVVFVNVVFCFALPVGTKFLKKERKEQTRGDVISLALSSLLFDKIKALTLLLLFYLTLVSVDFVFHFYISI
jgi:hypothetical protein